MEQLTKNHDSILVKDCIFTALMLLMEQKDFDDITITEIAKKAGVSRMTYYRTYSSKEDILIQYFDETAEKLIDTIKEQPNLTPYDLYVEFFAFFNTHTYLIEKLIRANLFQKVLQHFIEFVEYLFQTILKFNINNAEMKYQLHYHTGGLFALTNCWIQSGKKEAPEEMAKLAVSIITHDPSKQPVS